MIVIPKDVTLSTSKEELLEWAKSRLTSTSLWGWLISNNKILRLIPWKKGGQEVEKNLPAHQVGSILVKGYSDTEGHLTFRIEVFYGQPKLTLSRDLETWIVEEWMGEQSIVGRTALSSLRGFSDISPEDYPALVAEIEWTRGENARYPLYSSIGFFLAVDDIKSTDE